MSRRLSEKSTFTLHMLHMLHMLHVLHVLHVSGVCQKKKDIRRKSNGVRTPSTACGRSPSLEEGGLRERGKD